MQGEAVVSKGRRAGGKTSAAGGWLKGGGGQRARNLLMDCLPPSASPLAYLFPSLSPALHSFIFLGVAPLSLSLSYWTLFFLRFTVRARLKVSSFWYLGRWIFEGENYARGLIMITTDVCINRGIMERYILRWVQPDDMNHADEGSAVPTPIPCQRWCT